MRLEDLTAESTPCEIDRAIVASGLSVMTCYTPGYSAHPEPWWTTYVMLNEQQSGQSFCAQQMASSRGESVAKAAKDHARQRAEHEAESLVQSPAAE